MAEATGDGAREALEFARAMAHVRRRAAPQAGDVPVTDDELWHYVRDTWGVEIPRHAVCC